MTDKEFINKFDNNIDFSADEILSICNGFILMWQKTPCLYRREMKTFC